MKPSTISDGDKFFELTVERFAGVDLYGNRMWQCRCSCGQSCVVEAFRLRRGEKKNCGMTHKAAIREADTSEVKRPPGSAKAAIWDFLYHWPPPVPAGDWLSRFTGS